MSINMTRKEFENLSLEKQLDIISSCKEVAFLDETESGGTHYEYCSTCCCDSLFASQTSTCLTCGSW